MKKKFKSICIIGTDLILFLGPDSTGENPSDKILLSMSLGGTQTKPIRDYNLLDIVDIKYTKPKLFKKGTLNVILKDNQQITEIRFKDKSNIKQIERLIAIVL